VGHTYATKAAFAVASRGVALAQHANAAPAAHSFADWLKQTIDKRK